MFKVKTRKEKGKKVLLAISGGVDSSVSALLLKKQGYEVYGFFMNCQRGKKARWPTTINWKEDERIVREICRKLGIKVFIIDCEDNYEKKQ